MSDQATVIEREDFTYRDQMVRIETTKTDSEYYPFRVAAFVENEEVFSRLPDDLKEAIKIRKKVKREAKKYIKTHPAKSAKVPLESIPAVRKMNAAPAPRGLASSAEGLKHQEREEFPDDYHKIKSFVSG